MTIVKILDDVTAWAQQNICNKILLKVPPKNTEPIDSDYEYTTANPVAFTMYVPTEDKLPAGVVSAFPSLCVRFLEGEDNLHDRSGIIGIQLLLSVWNPGTHGWDSLAQQANGTFQRSNINAFVRDGGGWRDVWNFADVAVQAIESVPSISGYEIDHSVSVKFGPLTEQESIPDFYPFWFAWVTFQLKYPLRRNNVDFQEFL